MVGTSVRDRKYDHAMANMTASAIGTNRKRGTPSRKNIGTNTMQMQRVDTKAGVAICWAPSVIAAITPLPCSRCQLMFSMVTVASSTRMPTARARPPNVMMFRVSPASASMAMAARMASGIEVAMMTVERQVPRNSRIIRLVSRAAITASETTPPMAFSTNRDWSLTRAMLRPSGSVARISATRCLMPSMMASVDAAPFFNTCSTTERPPSTLTMFC